MLSKKQSYIKGAVILSVGSFISKLLGAVYRIPLISFLGGKGMGIYQMVYPLYCMLLTVSASGIPTGIARLVSSGRKGVEKSAFKAYGGIGLIGCMAMYAFAKQLARLQGEAVVEACAKLLSPSVFFVSVLSVIKGYYQGKSNMYPTAISEVIEQFVKVVTGSLFAYVYRDDVDKAVQFAILAVTLSEIVATFYAVYKYLGDKSYKTPLYKEKNISIGVLFKCTLPLTLTALALPFSQFVESIVVVNLLRKTVDDATSLYGIYSGCAATLVGLPVSLTYGLAASSVPQIAPLIEKKDFSGAKSCVKKSLMITFVASLPFAIGLYAFCPLATKILFRGLKNYEKTLVVRLVRITSINAITQSLVQTSSVCLSSLGKPLAATRNQWLSCLLRVAVSAALIVTTPLSVDGAAISANCSYLVALILNIWYIIRVNKNSYKGRIRNENNFNRSWYAFGRRDGGGRCGT